MTMRSWTRATVLAAVFSLTALGCDKAASTGTGGAGKTTDETYSKKLVGVWEGTEDMKDGGKPETVTVEFKGDGGLKMAMGPFEMAGTWKLTKEEGTTVTVDTEVTLAGFGDGKADKKTITITFEDANTIVMKRAGEKPDPKKLKRKS